MPPVCGQVATSGWEPNKNIILGYKRKLTKIQADCHNSTDPENTLS